jgi:hypothetical protein
MAAPRSAPEGLDYVPVPGSDPNLVFGVIRATLAGVPNTAMEAVMRRLFPVARPKDPHLPWPRPTCFKSDVLLPHWANSDYFDPQALCRAYDAQTWDGVRDLAIIMNFRFPEAQSVGGGPPTMSLAEIYELVRSYAYLRLTLKRGLATVLAMHVPSRAGVADAAPHCHVICLSRVLSIEGFGPFIPSLAKDAGREVIAAEFNDWRTKAGAPPA